MFHWRSCVLFACDTLSASSTIWLCLHEIFCSGTNTWETLQDDDWCAHRHHSFIISVPFSKHFTAAERWKWLIVGFKICQLKIIFLLNNTDVHDDVTVRLGFDAIVANSYHSIIRCILGNHVGVVFTHNTLDCPGNQQQLPLWRQSTNAWPSKKLPTAQGLDCVVMPTVSCIHKKKFMYRDDN